MNTRVVEGECLEYKIVYPKGVESKIDELILFSTRGISLAATSVGLGAGGELVHP